MWKASTNYWRDENTIENLIKGDVLYWEVVMDPSMGTRDYISNINLRIELKLLIIICIVIKCIIIDNIICWISVNYLYHHRSINIDITSIYPCNYTYKYNRIHSYLYTSGISAITTVAAAIIHMCTYIYIYIHTYIHTYLYIHMCTHIYTCIYISLVFQQQQ
jgi:hypothetical protein